MGRSTRSVDAFTSNPKVIMPTATVGLSGATACARVPPHDQRSEAAIADPKRRCTRTPEIPQHAKTAVRRSTRGPIPVRSTPHYAKHLQSVNPERRGRLCARPGPNDPEARIDPRAYSPFLLRKTATIALA
jgi:hypothetical protein